MSSFDKVIDQISQYDINEVLKRVPSLSLYKGFLLREDKGKKLLVIQAGEIEEARKFMLQENITGLEINSSLGYPKLTIDFLKDFVFIETLNVIHQPLRDTEAINNLVNLKELNMDSYFYSPIDFNNFPNLESCSIHWTKNAKNLFSRVSLKILGTRDYKGKNLDEFINLINLEQLSIVNSPINTIELLDKLKKLKKLELAFLRKLTSLKGIENLSNLEELMITSCKKISSISEVSHLTNLKKLGILNCGKIKSLKPSESLKNLEVLGFYEDTNILDGDLSVLERLPKLKKFYFQNRKHYSHKHNLYTGELSERITP